MGHIASELKYQRSFLPAIIQEAKSHEDDPIDDIEQGVEPQLTFKKVV